MKLAGCTILYNPTSSMVDNLRTYIDDVDFLFIVDNSDKKHDFDYSSLDTSKTMYIFNNGNIGIASALNIAAKNAYEKGYEWLLTMDQDSKFVTGNAANLIRGLSELNEKFKVGVVTPKHAVDLEKDLKPQKEKYEKVDYAMTSGNILNLKAWQEVGGFKEKYFIDYVDHELCLRLALHNYKIFVVNYSFLLHPLGEYKRVKFLNMNFTTTNHNYLRRYYLTRNKYNVIFTYFFKFPRVCLFFLYCQIAAVPKILLFEENKSKKLLSYFRGCVDFVAGRYGKYRY